MGVEVVRSCGRVSCSGSAGCVAHAGCVVSALTNLEFKVFATFRVTYITLSITARQYHKSVPVQEGTALVVLITIISDFKFVEV